MSETETGPWSIQEVLDRFERSLVTYTARLLGDVEQARDVVQDTFLRFVRQGDELRDQPLEVVARWLYTTSRNRALDVLKREQRMRAREESVASQTGDAYDDDPSHRLERRELLSGVRRLLSDLPDTQQEALRLRFQHGMTYQQIADVMGQSLGNVGFLLHKGMHALRRKSLHLEQGGTP